MKKELTPEQLEKQQAKQTAKEEAQADREIKELALRRKQSGAHVAKYYLIVMLIVMTLAYLVDEMSTNITYALQSNITIDLFNVPFNADGTVNTDSAEWIAGVQAFSTLSILFIVFSFFMPFYKSLADKYGRKFLLVINTCAMAVAMLGMMISTSWIMFALFYILLRFVCPADVHSLYFMECAPPKHRVKISLGAKAIAILGISSVGLLRLWFITDDVSSWKNVYLIPVIIAFAVAIIVLSMIKETPKFIADRIDYLEKSPEQRASEAMDETEAEKKAGVLPAIKFVFKHRQLRWITISTAIFGLAAIMTSYYSVILTGNGMGDTQISYMVIAYPFVYAAMTFLGGVISDKWGRKAMVLSYGIIAIIAMTLFCLVSGPDNGVLSGVLYGLYVAGLWGTFDAMAYVMAQESSPTYLRASCMGVVMLCSLPSTLIAMVVVIALVEMLPLATIGIIMTLVGMIPALIVFTIKVRETYKVDLGTVRGDEWDKVKAVD